MKEHNQAARKRAGATYPLKLDHGVKIYRGSRTKAGRPYEEFTVVWSEAGKRQRRFFADAGVARTEADLVVHRFANGQLDALQLTGTERETFLAARSRAEALGKPLLAILDEYAAAVGKLSGKAGLGEIVEYWVRNYDRRITPKPLPEIADEFEAQKRADGCSVAYLHGLKIYLGLIRKAFPAQIDRITTAELDGFLRAGERKPRYRNNLRAAIITLFNFAKARSYLPKDRSTEADALPRAKIKGESVAVFTPDETAVLLKHTQARRPDLLPYVTLCLFAGARAAEVSRLDWADIRLDRADPHILLAAEKTKTASRRLVPVHPTLAAWLAPHVQPAGALVRMSSNSVSVKVADLAREAGLEWPKNVMRHSFISYRLADLKNAAEVALEAGNTPAVIMKNYREIVTPADARAYWALTPEALGCAPVAVPAGA